ncbi:MAG: AraC family transcriptional regulator [Coriobacteriia bacterium]|nr:AraC family transcriptional regulator [Coriobacteriia bacterium]
MVKTDVDLQDESARYESMHAPNPKVEDPFPVLVLDVHDGVSTPPRLGFKRVHWHDDLQFLVVTQGCVTVDCAGEHFLCREGHGAFFNSGVPHRVVNMRGSAYMSFVFPDKLLRFFPGSDMAVFGVGPFVGAQAQATMHFDLSAPWHGELVEQLMLARDILACDGTSGIERYKACVHLLMAWSVYISNVKQSLPSRAERASDERMKAFMAFIEENYGRDISLEDIACAGNVSKAECARCFKRLVQTTPYAYLLNYRIYKAMELIRTTKLGAGAIATAVGFGSPSHFSTAFKKVSGVTPKEYMMLARAQVEGAEA